MRLLRTRRALAVAAVLSGTLLGGAGSASAATEVWWLDSWAPGPTGTSTAPAKHSIVETSVRWLGGGDIACTSALELSGAHAGTAYCTSSVRAHPYNGTLRYAWAGGYAASSLLRGRWDW